MKGDHRGTEELLCRDEGSPILFPTTLESEVVV